MLAAGDTLPHATVWTAPHQPANLGDLAAEGRVLLVFYLFDWSST